MTTTPDRPTSRTTRMIEQARAEMAEGAALRAADPTPGAQTEHLARGLARTVAGYALSRNHLANARAMAASGSHPTDTAAVAQREEEHRTARLFLRLDTLGLLEHIDAEDEDARA